MAAGLTPGSGAAFAASLRRELRHWREDRWELALVTLVPLLLMLLMMALFSGAVLRQLPVALVDLDGSADSRALARAIDASPGVALVAQPASLQQAQAQLRALEVFAIVLLPRDMSRRALRGEPAPVYAFYNATYLATGQSAARDIADAVAAYNARMLKERIGLQAGPARLRAAPVTVQATVLYNPARSYELFLLPLIFPAVLSLLAALAAGGAFGRERRDGLLATWLGRRPWAAIAGKLLPYVAVFSLYGAFGVLYVAYVRGDGVAGSVWLLLLAQPLFYLACCCFALLFIALTRDMCTGLSLVGLSIGTALAFSGATFPVVAAPLFTRVWNALLPLTAYVQLQMQQLFMGSPWTVSLRPLGVLALMAGVAGAGGALLLARAARRAAPPVPVPA
ncbi:ABC transporter permease [Stenotrophomonas sp. Y6]|uniref:ABC transporter permease n=1 Tax=Stenotrophomonas sp. Y6 TaxID=2920383 RepID=UPI001F0620A4|nr:ABC transporter permease [Stenotrophomonas sp. Y6]MCH1910054.1 ABC transporter permease [Stenotrophomonas sp. Y6]